LQRFKKKTARYKIRFRERLSEARLLVDEIRIDGNQAVMRGSYENLVYAVGCVKDSSLEVPIFMREWRTSGKKLRTAFLKPSKTGMRS
jgi:hypothetical protein